MPYEEKAVGARSENNASVIINRTVLETRRYARYAVNARTENFIGVTVLNHSMLFTSVWVDRGTVPDGLFMYEVQHDDEQQGLPIQIADSVIVNHLGTLISDQPIALEPNSEGTNAYRDIDPEEDWSFDGSCLTLQEYMDKSPFVTAPQGDLYLNCDKEMMVMTNIGTMPLVDYREIIAQQYGFESYEAFYNEGYRLKKGYDKD